MKHLILTAFLVASGWVFSQQSYIQIKSAPGVTVFLDGDLKGVTNKDFEGLIIKDVLAGSHKLRFVKEGFNTQDETVTIKAGEVYIYEVKKFVPQIKISQKGNKVAPKTQQATAVMQVQTGRLKLQSLPVTIDISLPGLGINSSKNQDEWIGEDIPSGSYEAIFSWKGKELRETIQISADKTTELLIDFIDMQVRKKGEAVSAEPSSQIVPVPVEAEENKEMETAMNRQEVSSKPEAVVETAVEVPAPPLRKPIKTDLERYGLLGKVRSVIRDQYSFSPRDTRKQKVLKSILQEEDLSSSRYLRESIHTEMTFMPDGSRLYGLDTEYDAQGNLKIQYNMPTKEQSSHFWQYRYDENGNRVEWEYYQLMNSGAPRRSGVVTQEFYEGQLIAKNYRVDRERYSEVYQYNSLGELTGIQREDPAARPKEISIAYRSYEYDAMGNWITRHGFVDGELYLIEKRLIQYFD